MAFSYSSTFGHERAPGAGVTAVLGPTNTGKTHLAIERMLAHSSGIIGLPLRLLAREVYNKIVDRAGVDSVALITGEEKIKPPKARFWVSTVEAMPRDLDVSFLAVDEIQIAADLERGHVFHAPAKTHRDRRVLGRRGLCDRRIDPPAAWWCRRRARLAVTAHPQCAGRNVPER